jgi:hypothetical protein
MGTDVVQLTHMNVMTRNPPYTELSEIGKSHCRYFIFHLSNNTQAKYTSLEPNHSYDRWDVYIAVFKKTVQVQSALLETVNRK